MTNRTYKYWAEYRDESSQNPTLLTRSMRAENMEQAIRKIEKELAEEGTLWAVSLEAD